MSSASRPVFLDARDREGARGDADQRELRDQVLGRRRPVRLVLVVHLVAVRLLRRVEDHRHVRRPVGLVEAVGELPQHRRIAIDRARRLAVPVRQRRQPVIGAEDVARPVDEIEVRAGLGASKRQAWMERFSRVAERGKPPREQQYGDALILIKVEAASTP